MTKHAADPKSSDDTDEGQPDPVDHERQPGVPPETNDDYADEVDHEGADSFPASDPPGSY